MLRKALTLAMVFILALSLLAVSMITCFTYDAEANVGNHPHYACWDEHGNSLGIRHVWLNAPNWCVSQ